MKDISDDRTFRALADSNRRLMLDLVKDQPGMTVSELASHFFFSRYAVLKHLRVLEDAGLIVRRRNGKTKELYLNARASPTAGCLNMLGHFASPQPANETDRMRSVDHTAE